MWKEISLTKNKQLVVECGKPYRFIKYFDISTQWSRQVDHGGFDFSCSLIGLFYFNIHIYDIRNWNDKKKCFEFNSNNRW